MIVAVAVRGPPWPENPSSLVNIVIVSVYPSTQPGDVETHTYNIVANALLTRFNGPLRLTN